MPFISEKEFEELQKLKATGSTTSQTRLVKEKKEAISQKNTMTVITVILFLLIIVLVIFPKNIVFDKILEYRGYTINKINKTTGDDVLANDDQLEAQEEVQDSIFRIQLIAVKTDRLMIDPVPLTKLKKYTTPEFTKYSIGQFKTYQQAIEYNKNLKRLGLVKKSIIVLEKDNVTYAIDPRTKEVVSSKEKQN